MGAEYGEETVRVADLLEKMSKDDSDNLPAVVWIYHPADEDDNQQIEGNVFQNEQVGLAMKKFRTYRVNVTQIRSDRIREQYRRTPTFHFYDPTGEKLSELDGRKVTSLSEFTRHMGRTWSKSFTKRLRSFTKPMTKILDRLDRYDGQKQILEQSKARLDERPNPRKQREIEQEEKELEEIAAKIAEDEKEILESVELREEFRKKEDEVADAR